ncbi:MAG: molybdate ABC transporter permease subunit [Eggerthellaceae bacterium]|nr:molybdate ABC transporter permease subunit [Eggerthellaceae bacterium]
MLAVAIGLQVAMPCMAAWAQPVLSVDGDAVVDDDAGWGITGFHRAKKGSTAELPDGQQVGYRYITGDAGNIVLVSTQDATVLYVPDDTCRRLDVDLNDEDAKAALIALVEAVDEANADGATPLAELGVDVIATSEKEVETGSLTFRFAVEASGRTYATVEWPEGEQKSTRGWFCDYGSLVASADADIIVERTVREELELFLSGVDWSPLFVSLRTSLAALLAVVVVGTLSAWFTLRLGNRVQSVVDTLFLIPMMLPPSACGLVLVYVFGKNSATGQWLIAHGINLPFTWQAAVIAAAVVSVPYMYRSARGAFEGVDAQLLDVARTLGWSEVRLFVRLAIPLALPSLMAGVVLSFCRALGEFGATVFFAGNYAGVTQTIPLAIYYDWMAGDAATAALWVVITLAFTFIFMMIMRRLSEK